MDAFQALADPTRRDIVALLAKGERSASEIFARFDIADPSVSRHLKVLRESGLIAYRRQAQSRIYRLDTDALDQTRQWMQAQIDACRARFDRLGAHLDRMQKAEEKREKRRRKR
jgi:DNA-binding transcriptional ArsR family regulator